jgi:hypothetical protein
MPHLHIEFSAYTGITRSIRFPPPTQRIRRHLAIIAAAVHCRSSGLQDRSKDGVGPLDACDTTVHGPGLRGCGIKFHGLFNVDFQEGGWFQF